MKEFIEEMDQKDSELAQKFSNFLGEAIARLKKLFQKIFSTLSRSKEAQSLRKLTDSLEAIQSQYDALLERRATESTTVLTDQQQKNTSDRGVMNAERYAKTKTNMKILSLIEKIEEGNFKANDKVYFGNVSDSLAKKIYDLTNINVYGFKVAIEARQLEHILKDHGKQGLTDRSMSDYSNIAKIEYVLEEPDSIVPAGKTKAYTNMIDGKNKTANTILYEKNIGEKSYYVVQAVPDTKAKTLYVVTAFIEKTGYKKEATQLINANRLDATAKTESVRASKNSISNSSPSVNPQNSGADKGTMKADRATYMTARELLLQAMADEEIKKSKIYSPLLREYANRVTELDKKYMALEAAEHDYVASIDAFDSEEKQARYKYNMDKLAREISRIERDLTKQEESPELKRLVLREKEATRKQTEKEARRDTASRMSNYRKSIERKSTLERIEAKAKLLSKKLTENTRKSHIPDDLKQPLDKFLGSIKGSIRDLQYDYGTPDEVEFQEAKTSSEQSTFVKDTKNALKELRAAIEENSQLPIVQAEKKGADTTEESQGAAYSGILMIDPHILNEMDSLASYLETLTDDGITYELAELDLDQAKRLDKILTSVSRAINSIDRAFAGQGKEKISDLGESSMAYMKPIIDESKKKGSSKLAKFLKDATTWEEMTPYTAFKQFGGGGLAIYKNILRGWGDYAFYAKQILDFAEKTWTPEEAKKWSETVKTYNLAGQEFDATVAQIMYLYVLNRREQGKLHLDGKGANGGFVIPKLRTNKNKAAESKDLTAIRSTEEQREAFFEFHSAGKGGDWKAHPL